MKYIFLPILVLFSATCFAQERKQAEFPGGVSEFYKYIEDNIVIPQDASEQHVDGVVYVDFVVKSSGEIDDSSVKVSASLSKSCDKEAIRLIKAAPAWIPGKLGESAVEQLITFPIIFKANP